MSINSFLNNIFLSTNVANLIENVVKDSTRPKEIVLDENAKLIVYPLFQERSDNLLNNHYLPIKEIEKILRKKEIRLVNCNYFELNKFRENIDQITGRRLPFINRDEELKRIFSVFFSSLSETDETRTIQSKKLVFIRGKSGTGKTALINHLIKVSRSLKLEFIVINRSLLQYSEEAGEEVINKIDDFEKKLRSVLKLIISEGHIPIIFLEELVRTNKEIVKRIFKLIEELEGVFLISDFRIEASINSIVSSMLVDNEINMELVENIELRGFDEEAVKEMITTLLEEPTEERVETVFNIIKSKNWFYPLYISIACFLVEKGAQHKKISNMVDIYLKHVVDDFDRRTNEYFHEHNFTISSQNRKKIALYLVLFLSSVPVGNEKIIDVFEEQLLGKILRVSYSKGMLSGLIHQMGRDKHFIEIEEKQDAMLNLFLGTEVGFTYSFRIPDYFQALILSSIINRSIMAFNYDEREFFKLLRIVLKNFEAHGSVLRSMMNLFELGYYREVLLYYSIIWSFLLKEGFYFHGAGTFAWNWKIFNYFQVVKSEQFPNILSEEKLIQIFSLPVFSFPDKIDPKLKEDVDYLILSMSMDKTHQEILLREQVIEKIEEWILKDKGREIVRTLNLLAMSFKPLSDTLLRRDKVIESIRSYITVLRAYFENKVINRLEYVVRLKEIMDMYYNTDLSFFETQLGLIIYQEMRAHTGILYNEFNKLRSSLPENEADRLRLELLVNRLAEILNFIGQSIEKVNLSEYFKKSLKNELGFEKMSIDLYIHIPLDISEIEFSVPIYIDENTKRTIKRSLEYPLLVIECNYNKIYAFPDETAHEKCRIHSLEDGDIIYSQFGKKNLFIIGDVPIFWASAMTTWPPSIDSIFFLKTLLLDNGWLSNNEVRKILDVATGSGVLGLVLTAKMPNIEKTIFTDIDPSAIELTRYNYDNLRLRKMISEKHDAQFFTGWGLSAIPRLKKEERFDVLISSPPYLPTGPGFSKPLISPVTSTGLIEDLVLNFKEYADKLVLEISNLGKKELFEVLNRAKIGEVIEGKVKKISKDFWVPLRVPKLEREHLSYLVENHGLIDLKTQFEEARKKGIPVERGFRYWHNLAVYEIT